MSANAAERAAVKQWWADNPMTYGRTHGTAVYVDESGHEQEVGFGSRRFFEQVDETQYRWNLPLHANNVPFARVFPYSRFKGGKVLEVGCGLGTMAMNWAQQGARVTACDLNPVAVSQTRRRFQVFDLSSTVVQGDGGGLPFANGSFDYVYSWGVLHHSPRLDLSIAELMRVLRPGGEFGVMLYNRHSLRQFYLVNYVEGIVHGESRFIDPVTLASRYADGATEEGNPHTWPVTPGEMRTLFGRYSRNVSVEVFGDKELRNTLKLMLPVAWRLIPDVVIRAWANRVGWSIWISGAKT
jgi:ubiquinone/menaquinone biosynthesis C-methylase UbiE